MLITRGLGRNFGSGGENEVPVYVPISDPDIATGSIPNSNILNIQELIPTITSAPIDPKPIINSDNNLTSVIIDVTQLKPHIKGNI